MDNSKKLQHEAFVSNLTGAPLWESYSLISVSAFSFILRNMFACLIPILFNSHWRFVLDSLFLFVFPILSLTLLSDYHVEISVVFLFFYGFIVSAHFCDKGDKFLPALKQVPCDFQNRARFFSELRSLLMIFTCICILAVDFNSFPRRFAKTENYGSGIMDCGVGCFVIAMGSVSVFSTRSTFKKDKKKGLRANVATVLPLVIIGVLRVVSVRAVDYQEHVTEYGTHWNFFITLAIVKVLSLWLSPLYFVPYWCIAAILTAFQQCILYAGLERYIISENVDRDSFLSANREGILTLPGYLALFYWGAHFGDLVNRHLQPITNIRFKPVSLKSLCIHIAGSSVISGILAYLTSPISRRITNIAYIMWTVSFCSYLMFVLLLGDLCVWCVGWLRSSIYVPSQLLQVINRESLAYFLLANVITGCVNLSINTLDYSDLYAVLILIGYKIAVIFLIFGKMNISKILFNNASYKTEPKAAVHEK